MLKILRLSGKANAGERLFWPLKPWKRTFYAEEPWGLVGVRGIIVSMVV